MKVLEAEIQAHRKQEKLTQKGLLLLDYIRDLKKKGNILYNTLNRSQNRCPIQAPNITSI